MTATPERALLVRWFDEAHADGLWAAPWSKAVQGLSADQAAWTPAPGRHSIWQIVNHIIFWREHERRNLAGDKPSGPERERRNFEAPAEVTEHAWKKTLARLEESRTATRALLADPANPLERLQYMIPHDCYHVGQIMLLRAMQGLAPID